MPICSMPVYAEIFVGRVDIEYIVVGSLPGGTNCKTVSFCRFIDRENFSLKIEGIVKERAGCTKCGSDIALRCCTKDQFSIFYDNRIFVINRSPASIVIVECFFKDRFTVRGRYQRVRCRCYCRRGGLSWRWGYCGSLGFRGGGSWRAGERCRRRWEVLIVQHLRVCAE